MVASTVHPAVAEAAATTVAGPGMRVAAYYRMSSDEQTASIAQQQKEVRAHATRMGWEIVAEYIDEGRSASKDIHKRKQFRAMIADSARREWTAVLVWDTSRFSRQDPLDGAEYKRTLRDNGVHLESVTEGPIDWTTSMGRMMDFMRTEQNNDYSKKLSTNVIRGRRDVVQAGYFATSVPYGYDRQYVENGDVVRTEPRRNKFSKGRNWRLKPVPNADEAKVVKWVFDLWRDSDVSFSRTARLLLDKGIPSPSGKPSWTLAQVKGLLTERAYCGDSVIGAGARSQQVHNRIGQQVKENAIPALIDRKTFDAVQRKVREREGAEWRPKTASGPLSGVLKCGRCGHTLARRTCYGGTKYVCESATKRRHHGCSQWRVDEAELLPVVCRELVDAVDFEVLQRLAARPEKTDKGELEQLKREEQKLRQQVERAAKNLLLVDPENFAAAQDALSGLRRDHERLANALKLADSDGGKDVVTRGLDWWESVKGSLIKVADGRPVPVGDIHTLGDKLALAREVAPQVREMEIAIYDDDRPTTYTAPAIYATAETLRDLLRRLNVQVHLWWERYGETGKRWKLTTGVLRAQFNPEGAAIETSALTGGRRSTQPTSQSAGTGPERSPADAATGAAGAWEADSEASGSRPRPGRRPAARPVRTR